jgi:hypothetical protein
MWNAVAEPGLRHSLSKSIAMQLRMRICADKPEVYLHRSSRAAGAYLTYYVRQRVRSNVMTGGRTGECR